jgi:hypothetical protein
MSPLRQRAFVSSFSSPNLFEPRIAKRFEAGAEEDRADAQAVKLGCRLAPPSRLRLCEAESYPAQNLPRKKRAYKHVSNAGVLEEQMRARKRPTTKTKNRKEKMNSISTDQVTLPVLGLDVAKNSVQAELRMASNKLRFGFANNLIFLRKRGQGFLLFNQLLGLVKLPSNSSGD